MTLPEQIEVIRKLNKAEQEFFGWICINQGDHTPPKIANKLIKLGLVREIEGGYDVASHFVHMAWCEYCDQIRKDEGIGDTDAE